MKLFLEKRVYRELKKERTLIDRLALLIGVLGPLNAVPQLFLVWNGHTQGVSVVTWIGFMVTALILLAYALLYRLKPLIISNTLWLIVETGIIIGLLKNG